MKQHVIPAFLITETALYLIFTALDLFGCGGLTTGLKYAGILLCLLFSVLCLPDGGDRLVPFALLFTAAADLFLLVLDKYYLTGVLFFIAAQTVYLLRLYREAGRIWAPARILCALLAVVILFMLPMYSPLNLAAVLYFSLLLVNTAGSWTVKTRQGRIFALGLSLFVLCDICVGAYNLRLMPAGLYPLIGIGMWLFYLPSQVLISLSSEKQIPQNKS